MQQVGETLEFASEVGFLLFGEGGGPTVCAGGVGILGFAVEALRGEGGDYKFAVDGETVGVGGTTAFLDELLDDDCAGDGVFYCMGEGVVEFLLGVDSRYAFAAGGVGGLYYQRESESLDVFTGFFAGFITAGEGDVEVVVGKELAEEVFVLQNADALVTAGEGESHLFGYIGGGDYAGVYGEGHDAVDVQTPGEIQDFVLFNYAEVVVFVGVFVGYVAGDVVDGDDVGS